MQITYCERWFRARKCPVKPLDESQARKAYDERTLFTAVVSCEDRPACFLEFNNDYVGVGFLDEHLREHLSYQFQEVETGKLFLTMATHRDFSGESDSVKSGTTYSFKQDGAVVTETEDFSTDRRVTREKRIDVSGNWDVYPEFGQYANLTRIER